MGMQPTTDKLIPDHMRVELLQSAAELIGHIEWAARHDEANLNGTRRAAARTENALRTIQDQIRKGICAQQYQERIDHIAGVIAEREGF